MTFADNWSFIFENFEQAKIVISRLEDFCAALRLRLSIPKSWTWAIDKTVAQQLMAIHMQGEPIPNHQHVKDLGVDLTYRGKKTKTNVVSSYQSWFKPMQSRCSSWGVQIS